MRRPRWWELAPEAALAIVLGVFTLTEMSAALSAFKSTKAVALMIVVGAAWLGARLLLPRILHVAVIRTLLFGLAALAVMWIVVFPAYDDHTVVESLATRAAPTSVVPTTTEPVATTADPPPAAPPTTAPPATPTTTADPVAFATGSFRGIDHRASGTVRFYRAADGSFIVGLESFDIQPGPDYDVYIVPGAGREHRDGGARIDDLRGNRGTQYYDVPAGFDLSQSEWTLLVWCETFGVPVANATPI